MSSLRIALLALALAASCLLGTSCSRKLVLPPVGNQRPLVTLTQRPARSDTSYSYAYEFFWTAYDPDGSISHYLYAADPPAGGDTAWVRTEVTHVTLAFSSPDPDSLGTPAAPGGYHVFVLRAVDNRGFGSPNVVQAFLSFTIAPNVIFLRPRPSHLLAAQLPINPSVAWTGSDPDGLTSQRPRYYKYKLLDDVQFDLRSIMLHPDSLRRAFAPSFAGWDSVAGDTIVVAFSSLTPQREYLLVVVAFDEAGAYSAAFSLDVNMLHFVTQLTGSLGPRLTLWNDFFRYTYPSGGFFADPSTYVHLEAPAGQRLFFSWTATPEAYKYVKQYRWALDIERLDDETPRENEQTDVRRWSRWGQNMTTAFVGPFAGAPAGGLEEHRLYVEAEDSDRFVSLAVVEFRIIRMSPVGDLLFVDDTRMSPDYALRSRPDSVIGPGGPWPSAAELDTFFFAVGGVRWRYYQPPTQLSGPGVFKGYRYDTLGTRGIAGSKVPLALLARYRNVVWYTNRAFEYTEEPYLWRFPMTLMRYMSYEGHENTLSMYAALGGSLWLMGGGIAYNSLLPFNRRENDGLGRVVFSSAAGELLPGRLMWNAAGWRSEIAVGTERRAMRNPVLPQRGGIPYEQLPPSLLERTPDTDPLPPLRGYNTFYATQYEAEVLSAPNSLVEGGADPPGAGAGAGLDTLYFAGGDAPAPVMTCYFRPGGSRVVFSGFPVWYFQRNQAIAVGDFVLQRLFGLTREPVGR